MAESADSASHPTHPPANAPTRGPPALPRIPPLLALHGSRPAPATAAPVSPVRPPSSMPAALSMYTVRGVVPIMDPVTMPMPSDRNAHICPGNSSVSDRKPGGYVFGRVEGWEGGGREDGPHLAREFQCIRWGWEARNKWGVQSEHVCG